MIRLHSELATTPDLRLLVEADREDRILQPTRRDIYEGTPAEEMALCPLLQCTQSLGNGAWGGRVPTIVEKAQRFDDLLNLVRVLVEERGRRWAEIEEALNAARPVAAPGRCQGAWFVGHAGTGKASSLGLVRRYAAHEHACNK